MPETQCTQSSRLVANSPGRALPFGHSVHSGAEFSQLQAIRKRYNTPDRNSVATVLAPPELGVTW